MPVWPSRADEQTIRTRTPTCTPESSGRGNAASLLADRHIEHVAPDADRAHRKPTVSPRAGRRRSPHSVHPSHSGSSRWTSGIGEERWSLGFLNISFLHKTPVSQGRALVQSLPRQPGQPPPADPSHYPAFSLPNDPENRVLRLREAGAGQVVVDEALGAEPREQSLGDPLLQMQVHGVVAEHPGVLEDHRSDRRLEANPASPTDDRPRAGCTASCQPEGARSTSFWSRRPRSNLLRVRACKSRLTGTSSPNPSGAASSASISISFTDRSLTALQNVRSGMASISWSPVLVQLHVTDANALANVVLELRCRKPSLQPQHDTLPLAAEHGRLLVGARHEVPYLLHRPEMPAEQDRHNGNLTLLRVRLDLGKGRKYPIAVPNRKGMECLVLRYGPVGDAVHPVDVN